MYFLAMYHGKEKTNRNYVFQHIIINAFLKETISIQAVKEIEQTHQQPEN